MVQTTKPEVSPEADKDCRQLWKDVTYAPRRLWAANYEVHRSQLAEKHGLSVEEVQEYMEWLSASGEGAK